MGTKKLKKPCIYYKAFFLIFLLYNKKNFKEILMKNTKAFTLLELMIVIAIIAIIAAVAIPGILSARKVSNASAAFANLKSFSTAMTIYQNEDKKQRYPASDGAGGGLFGKYFNHLPIKSGYKYVYAVVDDQSQYVYFACPISANNGKKVYMLDESARIWEYTSKDADEDIVIQGNVALPPSGEVWQTSSPERVHWSQGSTIIQAADFIQKT